jgi:hypothetical protein
MKTECVGMIPVMSTILPVTSPRYSSLALLPPHPLSSLTSSALQQLDHRLHYTENSQDTARQSAREFSHNVLCKAWTNRDAVQIVYEYV